MHTARYPLVGFFVDAQIEIYVEIFGDGAEFVISVGLMREMREDEGVREGERGGRGVRGRGRGWGERGVERCERMKEVTTTLQQRDLVVLI